MINDSCAEKIKKYTREKLLLLGLCYAERSKKIIQEFDESYNEVLSGHFINKLEDAFHLLLAESPNISEIKDRSIELETLLPNSEDYPETQGGLALNGLSILCYCYRYLLTNQSQNIIYALNLTFEIADIIGSKTNENYSYEEECQKELAILRNYLQILDNATAIDNQAILTLREVSISNQFSYC